MNARLALAAGLAVLTVGACSPKAPEGVSQPALDEAISKVMGDANTCVLIGEAGSGKVVYRYNTHVACGRKYPACEGAAPRSADDLLEAVAKEPQPLAASCPTTADGSRSVGWTAGAVPDHDLVFSAVMEGDKALPGRVMADRLQGAFEKAGLMPARTSP